MIDENLKYCLKCGDKFTASNPPVKSINRHDGLVCRTCRKAEEDYRHYEQTGEMPTRNIRLKY